MSESTHDRVDGAEGHLTAYQYPPLDRSKASIRLLRISPDLSSLGCIQCYMWHADVEAQYTCLSYVWGSAEDQQIILLNNKALCVRKNLFDFLLVARTQYADQERVFWVDAISIDQASIVERNHQVAQMGTVYANASEVIGWLGHNISIERALRTCVKMSNHNLLAQRERVARSEQFDEDWRELKEHHYWGRAWITQEILLARRYILLVNNFEAEPAQFSRIRGVLADMNKVPVSEISNLRLRTQVKLFNSYLHALCEKSKLFKRPLAMLLHLFPGRECEIPRDRIYSLLSIASDAESFPIDYGSKEGTVLSNALDHLSRSMCLCSWLNIVNALECGSETGVLECDVRMPIMLLSMSPCLPKRGLKVLEAVGQGSKCKYCGDHVQEGGEIWDVYCTGELCNAVDATHFSLFPMSQIGPIDTRFKNHDLVLRSFTPYSSGQGWMSRRRPDHLEVTATVLIQFMRSSGLSKKDAKLSDIYQVPLELCHEARSGRGTSAFRATSEEVHSRSKANRSHVSQDGHVIAPIQISSTTTLVRWKAGLKTVLSRDGSVGSTTAQPGFTI